jgi:hypothetical protein
MCRPRVIAAVEDEVKEELNLTKATLVQAFSWVLNNHEYVLIVHCFDIVGQLLKKLVILCIGR